MTRAAGPRYVVIPVAHGLFAIRDTARSAWPVTLTIDGTTFTGLDNFATRASAQATANDLNQRWES